MSGKLPWRCFHCDEVFTDEQEAAIHFGRHESQTPVCRIDAAEYRRMEKALETSVNEDTPLHREIASLHSRLYTDTRRAEELGYQRGLDDAKAHPQELGLRPL